MLVYFQLVISEFWALVKTPPDMTLLRGIVDNQLPIAADSFWAFVIPRYMSADAKEAREEDLHRDLQKIVDDKAVTIPAKLSLTNYNLVRWGIFLNNFVAVSPKVGGQALPGSWACLKRARLVKRLFQGYGRVTKRRFFLIMWDKALADIPKSDYEQQLQVLKVQAVVTASTHKSVALLHWPFWGKTFNSLMKILLSSYGQEQTVSRWEILRNLYTRMTFSNPVPFVTNSSFPLNTFHPYQGREGRVIRP